MVEISLSGSGEGPGWVTGRGYSTAAFQDSERVSWVSGNGQSANLAYSD
jgi:hypothetical protein